MDIDGQDWAGETADPDDLNLDEETASFDDGSFGSLTLDGGDSDGDSDADGDADEEDMDCLGKLLANALKNVLAQLDPQQKQIVIGTLVQYALPPSGGGLSTDYYKGFFFLLVYRDKATGEPYYNASANYQSAPQQQQQLIQQGIGQWDALSVTQLWNDLAQALGESPYDDTEALAIDLILAFQAGAIYDDTLHTANNNFIAAWGAAGFAALVTTLATQFNQPDQLPDMASYMATYNAPNNIGQPPFALGAQAVLLAYSIVLGLTTAQDIDDCVGGE